MIQVQAHSPRHRSRNPLGGLALISLLLLATLPTTACTPTDEQIRADANAVAIACQSIAALIQKTDPALADKLSMAATALVGAVANWKTGNLTDDINTAANVIEVTLAAIPLTAPYAGLVAIAVAALQVLLANIPNNKVQALAIPVNAANPYLERAKINHRLGRSLEGDFRAAWNAEAAKVPGAARL